MLLTIDHDKVRELRFNRPPVHALTSEFIKTLREAVEYAPGDGVRALVLSGTPGRFSAGLDVPMLIDMDRGGVAALWRALYELLRTLASSSIPIATAITGHAPAGGTVIPLFCDWRIMAQGEFRLGLNEVQVGIPLPPVILGALRRLVGARHAEQLAVSGALVSPEEALRLGLVDELAAPDEVVAHAVDWCRALIALPSHAMTATRKEARADLVALFDARIEEELERVTAAWWNQETQVTLRAVVAKLKKKNS